MELIVVGVSHRSAPLEVREALALAPEQVRDALRHAHGERVLEEVLILSTCHRTEVYSMASDPARAELYVRELIMRFKGEDGPDPAPYAYTYRDRDTVRHLFRVAAGLDSMMLGEMQILGQVKDAFALATEGGATGIYLNRLLATALSVGKRARSETEIGAGAVSIASAAVALTTKFFSDLSEKRVLLVGAGETGRLAAKHFAEEHPAGLVIANRTMAKAAAIAEELGGEPVPLEAVGAAIARADIVVCATRAPGLLIDVEMVRRAMRDRAGRALVFVDIAVPRDVDPQVARLENVFVYPIDALNTIVDQNLAKRRKEARKVESIVEEEVEEFFRWMRSLEVTPTLRQLRERFERVRDEELRKHLSQLSKAERERIEAVTRSIVNKLLHVPTMRIKSLDASSDQDLVRLDAVRELFDLPSADVEKDPDAGTGDARRGEGTRARAGESATARARGAARPSSSPPAAGPGDRADASHDGTTGHGAQRLPQMTPDPEKAS